jgi:hypothetical protein
MGSIIDCSFFSFISIIRYFQNYSYSKINKRTELDQLFKMKLLCFVALVAQIFPSNKTATKMELYIIV